MDDGVNGVFSAELDPETSDGWIIVSNGSETDGMSLGHFQTRDAASAEANRLCQLYSIG